MKRILVFTATAVISISLLNACGPSEEEIRQREQARQDSLELVRQQQLEQIRRDSIAMARQDSIETVQQKQGERRQISFNTDGTFAIQVEAWRSEEKARAQVGKWKDRGFENAYVVQHGNEDTGDVWFRVRIGRVNTIDMANRLQEQLMDEYGAKSWVSVRTGS